MANVSVLNVVLHGEEIGTLTLLGDDRTVFAFNRSYIDDPDRLTLSLSFKGQHGELLTDLRPTPTRVQPFFANLLPEGPLREYLARRANVKPQREFPLLAVLGRDLAGAVVVEPVDGEALLAQARPEDHGFGGSSGGRALRFSLAGVQLKFLAVIQPRGGLTIPVDGAGGSWIVKLPSAVYEGIPENEYSMMMLARKVGIDVADVELHALEDIAGLPEGIVELRGSALAVRRFDRQADGGAVHIEDFAQVFGVYPEAKYDNASYGAIARVIWAEIGEDGITQYVRRLVFSALIGNGDMHLKNWSLIYPDGRGAALAPGYDFVSTIPYVAGDRMAFTLGRSKEWGEVSRDEIAYFAAKARLPKKLVVDAALETAERFMEVWEREKKHLPLASQVLTIIEKHLTRIPLLG